MRNKKIIKICKQKLIFLNYAENTQRIYLNYISEFVSQIEKQYTHLNSSDFEGYIKNYKFSSVSQQNQVLSSLKFLYSKVLQKKYKKVDFSRPRKQRKLPRVVEKKVLLNKLDIIQNLKHRTILSLMFGTGVRASELLNLKTVDVDSDRMLILIRDSKFNKDRYVPFSKNNLILLRKYFRQYRPKEFLFEGTKGRYTYSSLRNISHKYLDINLHKIRHSYATSLVEAKENLRTIPLILGHTNVKTVEIYTHVSKDMLNQVNTPI